MPKQIHKVYHVELSGEHYFFGSQAAIFDTFTSEQIGITLASLRGHVNLSDKPYHNKKCIIRLDTLKRKPSNRGINKPLKNLL